MVAKVVQREFPRSDRRGWGRRRSPGPRAAGAAGPRAIKREVVTAGRDAGVGRIPDAGGRARSSRGVRLDVEAVELVELIDRIHKESGPSGERVRYHYVIADYLCRVIGGTLQAASDADAVRWVERAEWNSHSVLALDPITVRVIEAGWQRARALDQLQEPS